MTEINGNSNIETNKPITKKGSNFIKQVLLASIIVVAVSIYPVSLYASKIQIYSFITGYLISLLNAVIGYGLNEMAFKKPVKSFMVIVFGGMGLRIILVGLFLLIAVEFSSLNPFSLVASVFVFYVLFSTIEILYLNKMQTKPGSMNNASDTKQN